MKVIPQKFSCCKEKEDVLLGVGEMRNCKTFWVRNFIGKYNSRVGGFMGGILYKFLDAPRTEEYTTQ